MKIAILGAGAMGMLFGSYLSQHNQVWLIDIDEKRIEKINADGVVVCEKNGEDRIYRPLAAASAAGLGTMDLVLVFVKSMFTVSALENNRSLIGPDTYLMTLQNGAGHEAKLLQFADEGHVIIGSTQHNSSVIANGHVNHGGSGQTSIGLLNGHSNEIQPIAENFTACGLDCCISMEIKRQIWTKLFTNTAASSLTAVLQVPLGFIHEDANAHKLMELMAKEAVAVANADCGGEFDEKEVIDGVDTVCRNAPNGYTSIYADVKQGVRSEVDTISGSVVETGKRLGMDAAAMTYPANCFDIVVLYNALAHVELVLDPLLEGCLRVLKPEGCMLLLSSFKMDKTVMTEKLLPLLQKKHIAYRQYEKGAFTCIETDKMLYGG